MSDEAREVMAALDRLGELVGQTAVLLRVEASNLETVYCEAEDGDLVVHDHGYTAHYLITGGDSTFTEWNADAATTAARGDGVELVDGSEPDATFFSIRRRVDTDDSIPDVVQAVAAAVDRVFHAHNVTL